MTATAGVQLPLDELRKRHYEKGVWARFVTIILGVWLLTAPFTFGYDSPSLITAIPTTGIAPKEPHLIQLAVERIIASDLITGVLVIFFGVLSLSYRRLWPSWVVCFLGIWLQFAPIAFWAPGVSMYLNDTFVGALLILFSIIVPKLPFEGAPSGPDIPPGWTYNPSSWLQRIPVIAFGTLGWFLSRYLTAYQLGYIPEVWDPFFGDGTRLVITSALSQSFPVADAGLGAVAYAIEALMGAKGSPRRWRTMPWMVVFFGVLVVPLGFCSILLVMMQPIVVGAWCGLCLLMAAAMIVMMALSVDEVLAVLQVLKRARQQKRFWEIFWKGDHEGELVKDQRTPAMSAPMGKFAATLWGACSVPWNLFITAILGGILMSLPGIYHFHSSLANNTHVFGALTIAFSILSWAEVTRICRFLLIPIGIWIALSVWFFDEPGLQGWASSDNALIGIGALLIVLAIRRGIVKEKYGAWQKWIV